MSWRINHAGDEARVARVVYSPASNELLAVVLDFGDLDEDDCAVWVGAHPDELELVMDAWPTTSAPLPKPRSWPV